MGKKLLSSSNFILLVLLSIGPVQILKAQKPTLTFDSYKNWTEVADGKLSNDGNYATYQIRNKPVDGTTLVITSTTKAWEKAFVNLVDTKFTEDSKNIIGRIEDTLIMYNFKTDRLQKIPDVKEFTLFQYHHRECLLIHKASSNDLSIIQLDLKPVKSYSAVSSYKLAPNEKVLLLKQAPIKDSAKEIVSWVDLDKLNDKQIFEGTGAGQFIFDLANTQLAFMVNKPSGNSIWYYKPGNSKASEMASNKANNPDTNLVIKPGAFWRFSPDGKNILFDLAELIRPAAIESNPQIWNYQDLYLRNYFQGSINPGIPNFPPRGYLSSLNIETHTIIKLMEKGDKINLENFMLTDKECRYFVYQTDIELDYDNKDMQIRSYGVCDLLTGKKIKIAQRSKQFRDFSLSPDQRFLTYYKMQTACYYSYSLTENKEICISQNIQTSFVDQRAKETNIPAAYSFGWLKREGKLLVSNSYDLWMLDPENKTEPRNLTEYEGHKNHIAFSPLQNRNNKLYNDLSDLILKGFNLNTKEFGIYNFLVEKKSKFTMLCKMDKGLGNLSMIYTPLDEENFSKSKNSNNYLLRNESYNDAPNYYYSHDLRNWKRISNNQPQVSFNWLTCELHNYSDSNDVKYQGILYKPEDFDSTKKYPVVINYYMIRSNEFHQFLSPEINGADADIPYLVSNGYLVFVPDINPEDRYPGAAALNSVMSAADHLSEINYVNHQKMAVAGHSFGGYETNYIVTHTNMFKCAISASGASNLSSRVYGTGQLGSGDGDSQIFHTLFGQYHLSKTPTQSKLDYIENSPIFSANQMNTPLLLMANPKDGNVDFDQGRNFFVQLRSLGKPVWLLSYPGEAHGLLKSENVTDYKTRVYLFLDHYLKSASEPAWMRHPITSKD